MVKNIFSWCLIGSALYVLTALALVAPQWVDRKRVPRSWVGRLALRFRLMRPRRSRVVRVRQLLAEHHVADAELPSADRLEKRFTDLTCSLATIYLLWLLPFLGVLAALMIMVNARVVSSFWMLVLLWGLLTSVLVLADVDRRSLLRSVPHEHTVHMAIRAWEAITSHGSPDGEIRGRTRNSAFCDAIGDLCDALERQAELEPRRTDPVHRSRLRDHAHEIVRNLHTGKIRLSEGDQDQLAALARIIASVLKYASAPTNALGSSTRLADPHLLSPDPDWDGPRPQTGSPALGALGYALFICIVAGAGYLLSLTHFPEAITSVLVVLAVGAGHALLKRMRLPFPSLPPSPQPEAGTATPPSHSAH
ncbi:hypothetical protein [Streptomyces xanthochromogenes]|uniref:Uncharacterized protein n=1 Tax=Streptomyces xanthochromogenes TaxID=67384 RepID=A0ABQ3AUC3_9ACTN|nr:hypothetical protein [Streptomyces xanthochromogenes]GGY67016.1 hypothetical protein GCM10010326_71940 [Streptomyces xanthochromogenes]